MKFIFLNDKIIDKTASNKLFQFFSLTGFDIPFDIIPNIRQELNQNSFFFPLTT